jgi:hypothetical protein
MPNEILARSPHIIEINESGQDGSMLRLYLWNGLGSAPSSPTYTFTKLIPSALQPANYYNISPYIREYISNLLNQNVYNTIGATNTANYVNVKVKRYKLVTGVYTLLDEIDYYGWDGFYYYNLAENLGQQVPFLDPKTYYYLYDPNRDPSTDENARAGFLTLDNGTWDAVYTNLRTGATWTPTITGFGTALYHDIPRVYPLWYADGNKLEIYDNLSSTLWATYYFKPIQECKYDTYTIDFVNRYGAWQREFFFKASFDNVEIKTNQYQLMTPNPLMFTPERGTFKDFNINGKQTIKLNTGFVKEDFKENLTQLMLSERILINGLPVTIKTKNIDRTKQINNKMINYTIEFEMAFDVINNIV